MANVKITQLPLATTPLTGTEVFPLVQGTTTKQVAITGLFTSPVMTNPTLGTVGQADLINATGLPISTGVAGLGAGIATFLGTPSSANLRTAVTDETGTGSLVFANSPALITPDLGTPSVLVATNATGTAVGLTAGSAITNANLTGAVTSVGNATSLGSFTSAQLRTALTDETGAGVAVFATSPTITAPILNQINDTNNAQILGLSPTTSAVDYLVVKNGIGVGVPLHFYADGSSANIGLHIQPKGTGLITISDGTDFNKGIRFRSSGSAASAITLLDAVSTAGRVVTLPDATTTLVGRDTTDTLTNKTIAFSSNTFTGALAIANGGTGQSTANAALNALLPSQTGNASKYLQTDGTNSSWDAISLSTADITGTLGTANGGTNLTSFTSGGVVYASSTSALATGSGLTWDGTALRAARAIFTAADSAYAVAFNATTGNARISGYDATYGGTALVTYSASYAGYGPFTVDALNHRWWISGTEGMRLTSTGLGIGTSSPITKLQVSGTNATLTLSDTNASGGSYSNILYRNTDGTSTAYNIASVLGLTTSNGGNGALAFYTAASNSNTERMRLDSAGNLGLGVTPSAWSGIKALQVGGGNALMFTSANAYGQFYMLNNAYYNGSNYIYQYTQAAASYVQNQGAHQWFNAASGTAGNTISFTQAMTLDSTGQLLLGTTSAITGSKLTIGDASGSTTAYEYLNAGTGGSALIGRISGSQTWLVGDTVTALGSGTGLINFVNGANPWIVYLNGAERARIDSSGNMFVNRTSQIAAEQFGVGFDGATKQGIYITDTSSATTVTMMGFYKAGAARGSITSTATATAYITASDYRLKNTIEPMTGALAKVAQLKPVSYKWDIDGSEGQGFIAHELAEICPQAVVGEKDAVDADGSPKYQGIDTSFLVATLTAAIQELKAEFDAYKASHP